MNWARPVRIVLAIAVFAAMLSGAPYGTDADAQQAAGPDTVTVYLFWERTCPYCQNAKAFLEDHDAQYDWLTLRKIEVSEPGISRQLFFQVSQLLGVKRLVVPLTIVGTRPFLGYDGDATTGADILEQARTCRETSCPDLVAAVEAALADAGPSTAEVTSGPVKPGGAAGPPEPSPPASAPQEIDLPLVGTVSIGALSLPLLTVVLAAADGFNPCAMWVLIFLIGLLVGMKDNVRMWALGIAFLVASAGVYFAFMAAWLNLLLLLGALIWIRIAVGLVALAGGAFYLREFAVDAAGLCKITSPGQRRRVTEAARGIVRERRFLLALGGIVVLAAAVNLIELFCSAGIPAVYTQVLALSDLSLLTYYSYLLLYIGVFLLDDIVIFVIAMLTVQAAGFTGSYSRFAHLVGGIVMLAIGALLLFRPETLAFA
jgi:hypothetical protein